MGRDSEDGDYDLYKWQDRGKGVCEYCVQNKFLKSLISQNATSQRCNFCSTTRESTVAAPVGVLMESILGAFKQHFSDPTYAGCPNDADAQELICTISSFDALHQLFQEDGECSRMSVVHYIADGFVNPSWIVAADGVWMGAHVHEALIWSWQKFVQVIKHQQRFFFHVSNQENSTESLIPSTKMLATVGDMVNKWGLVKQVDAGTKVFRARKRTDDDDVWPFTIEHLGAPPPQRAKAGRMNPAGISYLYTSLDIATTVAETLAEQPAPVVIGSWIVEEALTVVDFTNLLDAPSVFDNASHHARDANLFLNHFVKDIQKSVLKNDDKNIEYLPTQVISEYFSHIFKDSNGLKVVGLKYRSVKNSTGVNLVFFPNGSRLENRFPFVRFTGARNFLS